ncbi:uncharacterized protein LOC127788276 [Diospyros lotus]|uniref:uncharacterized protein LOC127788276 n=1 Tax=Diospyros lotus TaxID=55363 RepID=UPI0022595B52|nr:uncharacterized protein LOC127788276 [Diospyros lotus]
MATRSYFFASNPSPTITSDTQFEFDDSEVWKSNEFAVTPDSKTKPVPSSKKKPAGCRRSSAAIDRLVPKATSSLPVNIPDWSKILRGENRRRLAENGGGGNDVEDDEDGMVIPPHEYLARTRMASLSVHEGVGRTLKGRDLSRVRNAIWKQTGFED